MKLIGLSIMLALAATACQTATVGVKNAELRPDSANTCVALCGQIGMALDSVVIMAENVGCVCGRSDAAPGAAASAGGMAAVLVAEAAHRAAAAQQQQAQRMQK